MTQHFRHYLGVRCDYPGCRRRDVFQARTKDIARKKARAHGWTANPGSEEDRCPRHKGKKT